ncbi:NAD(P)H-hydrate dehydratase [Sphingobium aquiterrae]|uniref:NAD(P)H-hydrate dehydratase n=1 Tax=Sphingobium aquiterrae TaxID=2038656 RepID=UPI0030169BE1
MTGLAILTADEMRAAERALFDTGIPEYDVMERAGAGAADAIWRAGARRDALIVCGPGNNGGDGYVVARLLRDRGVPVRVAACADPRTPSAIAARAAWGGPVEDIMTAAAATQLVDALFGTGLARGLDAPLAARLNELAGKAAISHAIDLPSGLATDSGACLSPVPTFDLCITFGALKPAHMLRPGSGTFRRLVCAEIGIDTGPARMHRLEAPSIGAPDADAHKYSRGLVAIVPGPMVGAGVLAACAAAHGGAGAVRYLEPHPTAGLPEAVVRLDAPTPAHICERLAEKRVGAVLVGPGLGRDDAARARLRAALAGGHPAIVDADGIMLLAEMDLGLLPPSAILTPHQGEFASLFGDLPGSKVDRGRAAAARSGAVLVYKGPDTVIAAPDGRVAVAPPGSSWLSTAGTGDVLAGLCAARLAVGGDPFRAACEAVWLHGEAARLAGPALIADDLAFHIPAALASRL